MEGPLSLSEGREQHLQGMVLKKDLLLAPQDGILSFTLINLKNKHIPLSLDSFVLSMNDQLTA